ncbi:MAG: DUF4126 domain-containing protein [Desulfobacterales bacterium]|nr:DUF4126 domain-containing protein [Desulfobacterales bacterium]
MEQLDHISSIIALSMGVAWASGINLYAAILVLGLLGVTNNIILPEQLEILMNPMVIGAAGIMYLAEFVADKTPGVDSGWDTIHTFIRIPAGALLAAGAVGNMDPAVILTAGILGGGLAAGTHATKSGSRLLINASPEPFSNWIASLGEDVAVIGGLWIALHHPIVFICLLVLFIILMIWLLPRIWQGIKTLFASIKRLFGDGRDDQAISNDPGNNTTPGPAGKER